LADNPSARRLLAGIGSFGNAINKEIYRESNQAGEEDEMTNKIFLALMFGPMLLPTESFADDRRRW
jgi:hypothetical protein